MLVLNRARIRRRFLSVFLLLWSGMQHDAAQAEDSDSFCRNVDERTSALLNSRIPEGFAVDVATVRTLVRKLQDELDIPLSFIKDRTNEQIVLPAVELNLEELLQAVADQHPEYRCEVRSGRLILRSRAKIFDRVIQGVDVVDRYRFAALNDYVEHLRATGDGFESWTRPLVGGNLDSPLFDEKVTLTPKAPLLDHLVQLLGRLPNAYFTIPAPGKMPRTIRISATQ